MKNDNLKIFIDFDGTIATVDVVDLILERYASPEWLEIEKEWAAGKIGSRECLTRQLALVSAGKPQMEKLLNEITIDPFFPEFIKTAQALEVPIYIVSDGFDYVIKNVLSRKLPNFVFEKLQIFCNKMEVGHTIKASFPAEPCEHGCANCKPRIIKAHKKEGDRILFIGDGLSDRYAAEVADLTFAKKKLLNYCIDRHLPYKEYSNFHVIQEWISSKERIPC